MPSAPYDNVLVDTLYHALVGRRVRYLAPITPEAPGNWSDRDTVVAVVKDVAPYYRDEVLVRVVVKTMYHVLYVESLNDLRGVFDLEVLDEPPIRTKGTLTVDPDAHEVDITVRMTREEAYRVTDELIRQTRYGVVEFLPPKHPHTVRFRGRFEPATS